MDGRFKFPRTAILAALSVLPAFSAIPGYFEPNQGQAQSGVSTVFRRNGHSLLISGGGASWISAGGTKEGQLRLIGSKSAGDIEYSEPLTGISNYFIGSDPSKWHSQVHHFARVTYRNVYPGIDLTYYENGNHLEYDFVVHPGADPGRIRFDCQGVAETGL